MKEIQNRIAANKKRVERQKTGGGPAALDFTPAEQLALQHNWGRPMMECISGGSSSEETGSSVWRSYVKVTEHSVTLLQPPPIILDPAEEPTDIADRDDDVETISVCSTPVEIADRDDDVETISVCSVPEERDIESQEDVRSLYKFYLWQKIAYRQMKMRKLEKEIQLLDKQLLDDHP
ncbi:UNVERIFIED_CONTAM: hypothetical protein FKN15_072086 [Acipenser sinensis]